MLLNDRTAAPNPTLKKPPVPRVAQHVLHAAAKRRVAQWDARARAPREIQLAMLLRNVRRAAPTEFGRAHDFAGIRGYEDFKKRVPLRTYAGFEPYLERMRQGARDVLWPGLISYYGQSSGSSHTAAQHKYLPISMEQIAWQKKAGFDLLARYVALSGKRDVAGGYTLGLFPPSVLKPESPGVFVGSNPGIMLRHVPRPAKWLALPRPPVRDIAEYEQKLTATAEAYLDHDIRSVSGTTCWFSVFFDRLLKVAQDRSRRVSTVGEIWPNLRVLFGGGVNAEPYRQLINDRVGRPVTILDNYNATEGGIFAATDSLTDPALLMVPDRGVFFEFVPREEHGKPDARRVPLWEVEAGQDYSVALTTSSGLFGYYIGDFVRFVSTFPHRMIFTGRASGVLSLTQELTSAVEIEGAFASACRETGARLVDFAASSEVGVNGTGSGRYVLFAEFEKEPSDLEVFREAVDRGLCAQNRVYREHRSGNVAILAPRLVRLRAGGTRDFMPAAGYQSVQNKFPRILDEKRRDILYTFAQKKH